VIPLPVEPDVALAPTRDPVSQAIVAVVLIVLFVTLSLEKAHRVLVVTTAAALLLLVSYATPYHLVTFEVAKESIDFNVLVLLMSMMAIVGVIRPTGAFEWAVGRLIRTAGGSPHRLVGLLAGFTAVVSAFADNVTTVIFVVPLAVQLALRLGLAAPALLLPVVMASNIGGTATLIGDPPNILIGSESGLSFLDFLTALTPPVLVIMLGLDLATRWKFRSELAAAHPPSTPVAEPRIADRPLLRASLLISGLVLVGFLTHGITGVPAALPAGLGAVALLIVQDVLYLRRREPTLAERSHGVLRVIERDIEWPTLAFFTFLFVVVGAAVATGLIDQIAAWLHQLIGATERGLGLGPSGTLLFAALLVLWTSGVLSALIDNIPFVVVMLPVIGSLTASLEGPVTALWWALALGACLGGNGTVIGASANVTTVGLAERSGVRIEFGEFARFGVPIAVWSLLVASGYLVVYVKVGAMAAALSMLALLLLGLGVAPVVRRRTAG